MSKEYSRTIVMDGSGQSSVSPEPQEFPRDYQPTRRMSDGVQNYANYGQPASAGGTDKTVRLHREPPTFAWLVVIDGVHAGFISQLRGDATVIGRDPSCDVVIDDNSVTRQHAKIRLVEEEREGKKTKVFLLHDLATENGTFVNDEEVVKQPLQDGDHILIGRTQFVFKQVQR